MSHYEYCQVKGGDKKSFFAVVYSPGGLKFLEVKLDRKDPAFRKDFEQWKQEIGFNYNEDIYAHEKLICQLLADGWEWWQIIDDDIFRDSIFRRQVELPLAVD